MSSSELLDQFGALLQKLPKRQIFAKLHVDYVMSREIEGHPFTIYFQMADDTNKLAQVLVRLNEMESRKPREDGFNLLAASLAREYGDSTSQTNDRYRFGATFNGISLIRTWRFPTTTIELDYEWDDQIFASTLTIRYFRTR
jgi:hypothetical protein